MSDSPAADDRRNRFLEGGGNGNGASNSAANTASGNNGTSGRAASQPPHHTAGSPFLSPTAPHAVPTSSSGNNNNSGGGAGGPWSGHGGLLGASASHRSASFSAGPRFASTFEDDELVDPDDELYDARYNSPTSPHSALSSSGYRGRTSTGAAPDLSRSRSQSLATATAIGAGRASGLGMGSAAYGIGSAANSYSNAYLYGNNAYGHPYGTGGLSGSLGGAGGTQRVSRRDSAGGGAGEDGTNMSPFVRDVGSILLDDGSFRELWERERGGGGREFASSARDFGFHNARDQHPHPSSYSNYLPSHPSSHSHTQTHNQFDENGPGMGSGTTSRRHSVSVVQPARRLAGFNVPDSPSPSHANTGGGGRRGRGAGAGVGLGGLSLNSQSQGGYGHSAFSPGAAHRRREDSLGPGPAPRRDDSRDRYRDGERYDDRRGYDDPHAHAHVHTRERSASLAQAQAQAQAHPGSLPIHAPLGRSPSMGLSIGAGLGLQAAARELAAADVRGGGGREREREREASKDWADAYFSPPRESVLGNLNINTSVGAGMRVRVWADSMDSRGKGMGISSTPNNPTPHTPRTPARNTAAAAAAARPTPRKARPPRTPRTRPRTSRTSRHTGPDSTVEADKGRGQGQGQGGAGQPPLADLGKGLPLHAVPPEWPLYIVEFKAGRTDLFYRAADRMASQNGRNGNGNGYAADDDPIRVGDLVIVEADRGKDLGKVVNDSITLGEVEAFWAGQQRFGSGQSPPTSPGGAEGGGSGKKEIAPKMIYGKAGAGDAQLLVAKMQDELKALALCQTKVRAKKLPMEVVDAEYQWDRRKLTFYFVAEKRIDFRELVRELFRLYKTRIWMASLQGGQ
ncbi:PSP1 C-terminal domain-containing protein [Mycena venus]|uniref:PSP1 C-terminal domain-containing protein n=1 Tax=Mycena venus TaxID=2733690 RepID=A0A8H6XH37_9AGAR|nr:PSP1 C-terminal domain-containing protein [Mycena venus]